MKTPHKHAELIKQWADGAQIEFFDSNHSAKWQEVDYPVWNDWTQYRVKPEQKPDKILYGYIKDFDEVITYAARSRALRLVSVPHTYLGVEYTFDGNTGKLKSIKMVNNETT